MGLTLCESALDQRESAVDRQLVQQMYPVEGVSPFFKHVLSAAPQGGQHRVEHGLVVKGF